MRFSLQNPLFPTSKALLLRDEHEHITGYVSFKKDKDYEDQRLFCFQDNNNNTTLGINKTGLMRLVRTSYTLTHNDTYYTLQEKLGPNLIYFCVTGTIHSHTIIIEENWDKDVEIKVDGVKLGVMHGTKKDAFIVYHLEDALLTNQALFGLAILSYFIYQVFLKDADFIMQLLWEDEI